MTVRHHYNINLPVEFTPVLIEEANHTQEVEKEIPLEIMFEQNKQLLSWLSELKVEVIHIRFFQSYPGQVYYKHIDVNQSDEDNMINAAEIVKLNLIYNSTGSKMSWYKLRDGQRGKFYVNAADELAVEYPADSVDKIYTAQTDSHCLIDGGTIHDLVNSHNNGINRQCYSFFLENIGPDKLTWNSAIELFEPYIY
jgi:hypothetical protein